MRIIRKTLLLLCSLVVLFGITEMKVNAEEYKDNTGLPEKFTMEDLPLTLRVPTDNERPGFIFVGWQGSDGKIEKNFVITREYVEKNPVLSFTSIWEPIEYSITYDLDGGHFSSGEGYYLKYNVALPKTKLPIPVKDGCEFIGWTGTDLEEATKEVYIDGNKLKNLSYTAVWKQTSTPTPEPTEEPPIVVGSETKIPVTITQTEEIIVEENKNVYTETNKIKPCKPVLSIKRKGDRLNVRLKKYQGKYVVFQYKTKKTSWKKLYTGKISKVKFKKNLKNGYKVRCKTYKIVGKKKIYSSWSNTVTIK